MAAGLLSHPNSLRDRDRGVNGQPAVIKSGTGDQDGDGSSAPRTLEIGYDSSLQLPPTERSAFRLTALAL
ncbi:hypothetical protein CIB48_g10449 [Xylaria polymorpha]|nr:hypothetical protein CIB48_g10449 [Xylaria polymorpha]